MKFDDLDKEMRVFECNFDQWVLPEIYMVARIDGRSFTRLTKDILNLEAPFDDRFRDAMVETTKHLMNSGFNINYGYTQSDEISLLFELNENTFSRKIRKFNSVLAGEASAKFSLAFNYPCAFDCRISQLPNQHKVVDYFRWRNEDALRNSLNAYCYWTLRKNNFSAKKATNEVKKLNTSGKNELLFQYGINFNDLPKWQKRGIGIYWIKKEKESLNPQTDEIVSTIRRELNAEFELPMREDYSTFINNIINEC